MSLRNFHEANEITTWQQVKFQESLTSEFSAKGLCRNAVTLKRCYLCIWCFLQEECWWFTVPGGEWGHSSEDKCWKNATTPRTQAPHLSHYLLFLIISTGLFTAALRVEMQCYTSISL